MSRPLGGMRVGFAFAVLLIALLSGCARQEVQPSQVPSENIRLIGTEKLSPSQNRVEGIALSEFGAYMSLNRHRVRIPADAVKERTIVSIQEPDSRYVVADYGPEGLKFEKPVEVSMHYGGLDLGDVEEEDLTIYYYDPETEAWVDMHGMVDTVKEVVMIRTDHFSRYALSDKCHFQHVAR